MYLVLLLQNIRIILHTFLKINVYLPVQSVHIGLPRSLLRLHGIYSIDRLSFVCLFLCHEPFKLYPVFYRYKQCYSKYQIYISICFLILTGLWKLKSLQSLDLSFNRISQIDLSDFHNCLQLENLHLKSNRIFRIHPEAFKDLKKLQVRKWSL